MRKKAVIKIKQEITTKSNNKIENVSETKSWIIEKC